MPTETTMPPVPVAASRLLHRLGAIQQRKLADERTAKDYAIEFGGYLATSAERFMDEVNRSQEAGEPIDGDVWSGLQSAIYEFRKRAERVKP